MTYHSLTLYIRQKMVTCKYSRTSGTGNIFVFLILFFSLSKAFPQAFMNGSFENNSASADQINLSNAAFNAMMANTVAFGSYGDVDIITSSSWGPPQSGSWYIGLTGGSTDIVTMKLTAPLIAGNTYSIKFWDRGNAGFPVYPAQLGLSTVNNAVGAIIYTGPTPTIGTWKQRTATFIAPNNGQYISVLMTAGALGDWLNVDNFSFATPLPVELLSFTCANETGIDHLRWTTATEINNDHFDIERSRNASEFHTIGTVSGNGNSTQELNYAFDDKTPFQGINYYRLKQTDFNGHFQYSAIVAVNNESELKVAVATSLVPGNLTLYYNIANNGIATINDATGKTIISILLDPEENQLHIDLSKFAKGIYFISITDGEENKYLKVSNY